MVFEFLADPIGWIVEQHTWFLHEPIGMTVANLVFWPILIGGNLARCWYLDRRTMRRSMKRVAERERKKLLEAT